VRVLTVGSFYPPHHEGGYELVWEAAVRHLRERGHEVEVLCSDHGASGSADGVHRLLRMYWRDHAFPRIGLRERIALERHNAEAFDGVVENFAPDAIAWWAMGGMSLSLIERARRRGLAAIAFVNDDWMLYGPRADAWLRLASRAPRLAERLTGLPAVFQPERAAELVFASESVRRAARERRPDLDGAVVHGGIEPLFVAPAPEREWSWRLLYVGRIDPRKGIDDAIEALRRLPAEASLRIVGAGDAGYLAQLRERAAGLRVELAGPREHDELPAIYAEADAVVFPVRWEEPWGLVPLEAMGCGRPVVATGAGGSSEYLVDGENCLCFERGDVAALAGALERLAGDPALRARLRERGLATARANTHDAFNERVEAELVRITTA
jgi:glycosyltransferase involved in cell wall biosynthesis